MSSWIGLPVENDLTIWEKLAEGGGQKDSLHMTLAFLTEGALTEAQSNQAHRLVRQWCKEVPRFRAEVTGAQLWHHTMTVMALTVPSHIKTWVGVLRDTLPACGVPLDTKWGWTPHITIRRDRKVPPTSLWPRHVDFEGVTIHEDNVKTSYALGDY